MGRIQGECPELGHLNQAQTEASRVNGRGDQALDDTIYFQKIPFFSSSFNPAEMTIWLNFSGSTSDRYRHYNGLRRVINS